MKSFDEFCKKHELKRNLDYVELAWEAGQQSKQAEVDELKRELLNKTNEAYADGQRSMRKMIKSNEGELRKRIDEALKHLDDVRNKGMDQSCYFAIKILKGDQS